MTDTSHPVQRRTRHDTVFDKGKHRRVIAKLGPGDLVSFRLEGMRQWTDGLPMNGLYITALTRTVNRWLREENDKRRSEGKKTLKRWRGNA